MLFQSGNLLGHLSVEGNVLLAQRLGGPADIAAAGAIVESVGLSARAHALPAQLSGGELARAGLAVALANDPPLLLADEPTGELDSETADEIVSLLLKRAARRLRGRCRDPQSPPRGRRAPHGQLVDGRVAT